MIREKIIFDGRLEATSHDVLAEVEKFRFETFVTLDVDMRVEQDANRYLWVIFLPDSANPQKIINGYVEVSPISLDPASYVFLKVVSCREELDILYFQLSQRLQARFIIPDFPPEIVSIPWKELMDERGSLPSHDDASDYLNNIPDPDEIEPKYGTDGAMTKNQVRWAVAICKAYQKRGGTIEGYYNFRWPTIAPCSLDTFKAWMKDPAFRPK